MSSGFSSSWRSAAWRWPFLDGVVGGRGELQSVADRLDPELLSLLFDEVDYFCGRRSSSAPKKAAADFKISLARRSSRLSFCSRLISAASDVVTPARRPESTSACLTQLRSDSAPTPSWRHPTDHTAIRGSSDWASGSSSLPVPLPQPDTPSRCVKAWLHCPFQTMEPPGFPGRFKGFKSSAVRLSRKRAHWEMFGG